MNEWKKERNMHWELAQKRKTTYTLLVYPKISKVILKGKHKRENFRRGSHRIKGWGML